MKKVLLFSLIFGFILFSINKNVSAQMMGGQPSTQQTSGTSTQTAQDEAAGKAVWDKLQNKQVSCKDLKDDDFDVLGDFFMGNMMGSSHNSMNQMMTQRLGSDGEKQMHIALGKRLSGCDTNASLPQGASYFMPMLGLGNMMANSNNTTWTGGTRGMMGFGYGNMMNSPYGIFGLLTWIVLILFLILGSVYFWKEIQRKK